MGIRLGECGDGSAPIGERGNIGIAEEKRRGDDLGFLSVMHGANLAIGINRWLTDTLRGAPRTEYCWGAKAAIA
jgi:hypothetical protein